MRSGDVVDECAACAAELVVEGDAGGEGEGALEDAFFDVGEGAGAVAFEGERFFAGREDRFDPLPEWREVWCSPGFVFVVGADDGGVEVADGLSGVAAGVAFVAEQRFVSSALAAGEQLESDLRVRRVWAR
jgi:hypothetical protein